MAWWLAIWRAGRVAAVVQGSVDENWLGLAMLAGPAAFYMFAVLKLRRPSAEAYLAEAFPVLWWGVLQFVLIEFHGLGPLDSPVRQWAGIGFAVAVEVCVVCAIAVPRRRVAYGVAGVGLGLASVLCLAVPGRAWTAELLWVAFGSIAAGVAAQGLWSAGSSRRRTAVR